MVERYAILSTAYTSPLKISTSFIKNELVSQTASLFVDEYTILLSKAMFKTFIYISHPIFTYINVLISFL